MNCRCWWCCSTTRRWAWCGSGRRCSTNAAIPTPSLQRKTDFVALADAFGAHGFRAHDLDSLNAALDAALALSGPALIDVAIDCDTKVLPMIPPGGTINDIIMKG